MVSCQSDPRVYFDAPKIPETIVNECTGYRNGVEIDVTNFIAVDPIDYDTLREYYEDKEYRLYKCLKFRRCN